MTNSASTWGTLDDDSLIVEQPWVLAYTLSEGGLGEFFVAPVIDVTLGSPGVLVLGAITLLNPGGALTGGFQPDEDERLPGFDEEEDEGTGESTGL